jgi:spore germination cell wall hydrolase CwlJ-like protein
LQPPKYRQRRTYQNFEAYVEPQVRSGGLKDIAPYIFGGAMLIAAFGFAGHQIGRNASAHTLTPDIEVIDTTQTNEVASKSNLLAEGDSIELLGLRQLRRQTVVVDGKGDMALMDAGEAEAPAIMAEPHVALAAEPKPILKPVKKVAKLADERRLKIEPAAVNLGEQEVEPPKKVLRKLALAPKPNDLENDFKLSKAEKQKVVAKSRIRQAEENCLARAVYFEARSESALGQMAVAKVILNRVKAPNYPKTICGVVYQGSNRRNSCQFSFACDGQPDDVKQPAAWMQAKAVAKRAIQGDKAVAARLNGALFYHADYVKPKWARSMRKVMKIGTHIFYTGG